MAKEVYIVHCIDTEGPLNETLDATFERLDEIFGLKITPNLETLQKLQKGDYPINEELKEKVKQLISPQRLNMNRNWYEVDLMLKEIMSDDYRSKLLDSSGKGWVYNWFCMDHIGFNGVNPRHRDIGYHNIFDHYNSLLRENKQDSVQFHFHPVAMKNDCNIAGTSYLSSDTLYDILAHKVIDRNWFPSSFRPGFHCERPDSNWFLEQWIPFDYANQSKKGNIESQPDLSNGRWGYWDKAPAEWRTYHPSMRNYQKEGECKRYISRCLNMNARLRQIEIEDVEEAFCRANGNQSTILSFCNHDFRDMRPDIDRVRQFIEKISKKYPDVKFFYETAIGAVRKEMNIPQAIPHLKAKIIQNKNISVLEVEVENCFGVQPFLALKTVCNQYYWQNFDFTKEENKFLFTFDNNTFDIKIIDTIGIACNSDSGVVEVLNIYPQKEFAQELFRYND
ncbi:MAG: hypothetical protein IJ310_01250 [Clostridia bacterium]|nr:hypothetical protein [Clostridia bacterium]